MNLYKLKKEARQFFPGDLSYKTMPLERWESLIIPVNLLDEVEKVYIDFGRKDGIRTDLRGWSSNDGSPNAHFEFTVRVNDIENEEYKEVSIPDVMDEIQKVLNKYFKN